MMDSNYSFFNFWSILILLILFLLLLLLLIPRQQSGTSLPGPRGWPLLGNFQALTQNKETTPELFTSLSKEYGPIFSMKVLQKNIVVLADYDLVKEAFVKRCDEFGARPADTGNLFRGNGILMTNGDFWMKSRKFGIHALRDFGIEKKSVESLIHQEIEELQKELAKNGQKPIDLRKLLLHATSNIMCSIIFGKRHDFSDEDFSGTIEHLISSMQEADEFHPADFFPSLGYIKPSVKTVESCLKTMDVYMDKEIKSHEETYDSTFMRDFTDIYLQNEMKESTENEHLTRDNLKGIIRDFFLSGTETISATLYWAFLFMIEHPEVQKKCQDELVKVIGRGREVKNSDRFNLHYIQATLSEVQRLGSVLPHGVNHCTTQTVDFHGFTIPKNSVVIGSIHSVHHSPEYWDPDPESFRPERWLSNSGRYIPNEKLIPFSIGTRICLGEMLAKTEVFLLFSGLLQSFKFSKSSQNAELNLKGYTSSVRSPANYEICATEII